MRALVFVFAAALSAAVAPALAQEAGAGAQGACAGSVQAGAGLAGAALGGFAGSKMSKKAPGAGALVGAVAGGFFSSKIACLLTAPEQQQAQSAAIQAAEGGVGTRTAWRSADRPDVSGSSLVTAEAAASDGGLCRTVSTVVIVRGEETSVEQKLCRAAGASGFALADK